MKSHSFFKLVHVGTLRPNDKGCRGASFEGAGLSVSECPQAWVSIAKLGGLPWWEFSKKGNKFLDFHALTDGDKKQITEWAVEKGLLVPATAWLVEWFDDELGHTCQSMHVSEADAKNEAFEDSRVFSQAVVQGTSLLAQLSGQSKTEPFFAGALSLAAVEYSKTIDLDGVYWMDQLDVAGLSAPRAVIHPDSLSTWTVQLSKP